VELCEILGVGQFGDVYKGIYRETVKFAIFARDSMLYAIAHPPVRFVTRVDQSKTFV